MPVIIKPISATFVRDTDTFATMDPYCKILVGQQMQRTKTCNNGGASPSWTDTLEYVAMDPLLRIQCMDEDVTSDDLIGEGSFNLASIYTLPPNLANNVYVDLTFQGRGAGRVLLSIMHTGGGNMGGGWGGNMGGGWNQQQQPMGGNWGGQQQGWNQPPNNGWGQQQGFQPQGQQGWGGNQGQQGWGGNQGQQGWGNPGNNNGW